MARSGSLVIQAMQLALALGAIPGSALPVTLFTERAEWAAVSTRQTVIGFEDYEGYFSTAAGLTAAGVNFLGWQSVEWCAWGGPIICGTSDPAYNLRVYPVTRRGSSVLFGPEDGSRSSRQAFSSSSNGRLRIELPVGITSVGADFVFRGNYSPQGALSGGGRSEVLLYDAGGVLLDSLWLYDGFSGMVSTVPIATMVLIGERNERGVAMSNSPTVDNFAFGWATDAEVSSMPEPATLWLSLVGVAWMVLRRLLAT